MIDGTKKSVSDPNWLASHSILKKWFLTHYVPNLVYGKLCITSLTRWNGDYANIYHNTCGHFCVAFFYFLYTVTRVE